ncbi:WXG100 family type VII secretion target [Streptomyces actinomycinicus]|uniref:WXG100 family type VII secretion target n=1 Tax=Streptomyces actinomycinicus TaxID=1695166 RepID=A0A937JQX9_9ACTN|nr:WXG100 family type VII secretion target [Streptomyces actinomycinicus]MBL1087175.1 WXG100 family type VII secretion target [Streptomyces actinomycinicus]
MGRENDLAASDEDLTGLADDLGTMQEHLISQVGRMDRLVDEIEQGWHGPAAVEYRKLHRSVAEDAVRMREVMQKLEEAVRLSRDGFTATELDVLARLRAVHVDVDAEVDQLSTPAEVPTTRPRSGLDQL